MTSTIKTPRKIDPALDKRFRAAITGDFKVFPITAKWREWLNAVYGVMDWKGIERVNKVYPPDTILDALTDEEKKDLLEKIK